MTAPVWIDESKNRIYIRFDGFMYVEQMEELYVLYREAIEKARPRFTVLTYAESFKPGTKGVQAIVARMVQMAGEAGCRKVARVIGENPLGAMQIDRLAKTGRSYESKHFTTAREAETYLDAEDDDG
jgi:hypothetical protein